MQIENNLGDNVAHKVGDPTTFMGIPLEKSTYTYADLCPLYYAESGDEVQSLIKDGYKVDSRTADGYTPLLKATANGRVDVVKSLLAAGADPNAANNNGVTPLYLAVERKHPDIVNALLAARAEVNAQNENIKFNPLHKAVEIGQVDTIRALLASRADVNIIGTEGTPLHIAVKNGNIDIVKELIASGANVNAKDNDGITPLYIAAENGQIDIVKTLLASGANANEKNEKDGNTALYCAAKNNHLDVFKELLYLTDNSDKTKSKENLAKCMSDLSGADDNFKSLCRDFYTEGYNESEKYAFIYDYCDGPTVARTGSICITTPEQILNSKVQDCPGEGAGGEAEYGRQKDIQIIQNFTPCTKAFNVYNKEYYLSQLKKDQSEFAEAAKKIREMTINSAKKSMEQRERNECHITQWQMHDNNDDYLMTGTSWSGNPYVLPWNKCVRFASALDSAKTSAGLDGRIDSNTQRRLSETLLSCYNGSLYPQLGDSKLEEVAKKCNGKWW